MVLIPADDLSHNKTGLLTLSCGTDNLGNTFLLDRLELRLKDWDMLKSDDFMGNARVNLDCLRQHDYEFFDEELTGSKDEQRGPARSP